MDQLSPPEIDPATFLRQHCTLPALPSLIGRIQDVIRGDDVDIQEVIELISGDPALVAQIFKVVNSGYFGLPREITKIQFAIAFLGLNEVYRMVLTLSVINAMSIKDTGALQSFWFHSYYTALCVKCLAKRHDPNLPFEELWSAAILHDVGKLVYLKFFPEHYRVLIRCCQQEGIFFFQAEQRLGWPASALLGGLLCDHWRLPGQIKEAVLCHSLEDLPAADPVTARGAFRRMICLGNLVAVLSADQLNDSVKRDVATAVTASLGCDESTFLTRMGEIYELRLEVDSFMSQIG